VVPNTIAKDSGALEAYRKHIDESKELYKQLLAMGIPKEDARFVIPQSVKTTIVVTMNARELLHFLV